MVINELDIQLTTQIHKEMKTLPDKKHEEKFNNKRRAYDARIATNDLIFFKRYKIAK